MTSGVFVNASILLRLGHDLLVILHHQHSLGGAIFKRDAFDKQPCKDPGDVCCFVLYIEPSTPTQEQI